MTVAALAGRLRLTSYIEVAKNLLLFVAKNKFGLLVANVLKFWALRSHGFGKSIENVANFLQHLF